jgi:hypothetical protein
VTRFPDPETPLQKALAGIYDAIAGRAEHWGEPGRVEAAPNRWEPGELERIIDQAGAELSPREAEELRRIVSAPGFGVLAATADPPDD